MTMLDASLACPCKLTLIRYTRRLRSITAADNSFLSRRELGVVVERQFTHSFLIHLRMPCCAQFPAVAAAPANCQHWRFFVPLPYCSTGIFADPKQLLRGI